MFHHAFANDRRRHFANKFVLEFCGDFVHERFDLVRRDRAFLAGFFDAIEEFVAVEVFVLAIAFFDAKFFAVDFLVGGEADAATQTLPASTDGNTIPALAGINHFVVLCGAAWAAHVVEQRPPCRCSYHAAPAESSAQMFRICSGRQSLVR